MKVKTFTSLAYSGMKISLMLLLLLALLFSATGVRPVYAATTWTVTSALDDGTVVGTCPDASTCRLRTAISLAAAGDTIIFDSTLSGGIIHLASNLTLANNIIIDASALTTPITISGDSDNDGDNDVHIFTVNAGVTATLKNLILTKGKSSAFGGGAILNYGTLTVDSSTISASTATGHGGGGILNWNGTLTLTNSTISNNSATVDSSGGGVRNAGVLTISNGTFSNNDSIAGGGALSNSANTATITNTLFSGNTANTGGAIGNANTGTLNITNSTFSSNGSLLSGGGIMSGGPATIAKSTFVGNNSGARGGGIYNMNSMTISNSTFVSNSSTEKGGAIYNWVLGMALYSSTFSDNLAPPGLGGGIYNDGTLNYVNTIIANSVAGGDCRNGAGTNHINKNNLVEDGFCTPALAGDPKLGPLANNGGPTQTMVLLAGSNAINAGDNTQCAANPVNNLDQRGVSRLTGGRCDIGAVESKFSTAAYTSINTHDGWVLESTETSNQGLTTNNNAPNFLLGDDNAKKQYRGILSFDTSSLPDTATIAGVMLKVKQQNIIGGGNPVQTFQGFMVDVKTGALGPAPTLQPVDFQAAANTSYGPFAITPISSWYNIDVSGAKTLINKLTSNSGLTQIRLRFKLDDNNDAVANYLSLFSGDAPTASQPQLIIHYVP